MYMYRHLSNKHQRRNHVTKPCCEANLDRQLIHVLPRRGRIEWPGAVKRARVEDVAGVCCVSGSLACQPSETLLVMFSKQRGTRHGIYDCDRPGDHALLGASVQGVNAEDS